MVFEADNSNRRFSSRSLGSRPTSRGDGRQSIADRWFQANVNARSNNTVRAQVSSIRSSTGIKRGFTKPVRRQSAGAGARTINAGSSSPQSNPYTRAVAPMTAAQEQQARAVDYQAIVDGTGVVSTIDYARVVLAVAKGFELDEGGLDSLAARLRVEADHEIVDELMHGRIVHGIDVPGFADIPNLDAKSIVEGFRLMIDNGDGSSSEAINGIQLGEIDLDRKELIEDLMLILDPNAEKIIELHDKFDDGDFQLSDDEVMRGLLSYNAGDFGTYSAGVLDAVIGLNENADDLKAFIDKIDPDKNGKMLESHYAALKMSIAQGAYTLPTGADVILEELKEGNADYDLIDEAINGRRIGGVDVPGFAQLVTNDGVVGVQDLVETYRLLVDDGAASGTTTLRGVTLGGIDLGRNRAVTKALAGIAPQADQLVYLFSNFDTNRDFAIDQEELINGSFDYQQGLLGSVKPSVLTKIKQLTPNLDQVEYVMGKIDINKDGEISHRELIKGLLGLKQEDHIEDEHFDEDLFRTVLGRHEHYDLANNILADFDLSGDVKPTNLALAAMLKVKIAQGASYAPDADTFLDLIEMSGEKREAELEELDEIITELQGLDANPFVDGAIKQELLYDKLFSIRSQQTRGSLALVAILRTNPGYDRAFGQMKRYLAKGVFDQSSLIAIATDSHVGDEKLTATERGYFDDLLQNSIGILTLADHKKSSPADQQPTDTEAKEAIKEKLFADDIKDFTTAQIMDAIDHYKEAANQLDPDQKGSMTRSDYYAHSYYFSDQDASSAPTHYDFNGDDIVDAKDREIFFDVSKYLLSNG